MSDKLDALHKALADYLGSMVTKGNWFDFSCKFKTDDKSVQVVNEVLTLGYDEVLIERVDEKG